MVLTAMWRLRPLIFLALSQPRVALGTVSAARTDWESMTAAVGWGVAPGGGPDLGAQLGVQPGQGAVIAPGGEVAVDGLPGREVGGQVPPGASGPVQVQDRLDDPARRPDPRPAPPPGPLGGQVRGDYLPLGIGQVTGIAPGPPPGPARTLGTRGPSCLPGRHTSGSWGPRPASQPNDTPLARWSGIWPQHRFIRHSLSADDAPGVAVATVAGMDTPRMTEPAPAVTGSAWCPGRAKI